MRGLSNEAKPYFREAKPYFVIPAKAGIHLAVVLLEQDQNGSRLSPG
jgi:hypothetical protein